MAESLQESAGNKLPRHFQSMSVNHKGICFLRINFSQHQNHRHLHGKSRFRGIRRPPET